MRINLIIVLTLVNVLFSCNKEKEIEKLNLSGGEEYTFENPYNSNTNDYVWDFGNGTISHEKSPTYSYATPGTYIVSLSKYRNEKIIKKENLFLVTIKQLYKPRIKFIKTSSIDTSSWTTYYYNYFYIDQYASFTFEIENNDLRDDYTYEAKMGGTSLLDDESYTYRFLSSTFLSSGYYNLEFKMFDDNLVSDSFDTTIFVGGYETVLNLQIPDLLNAQTGIVSERYVFVYEKKDMNGFSTQNDRDDIINHLGPTAGVLVNSNDEIRDWETTSFSWYNTFYGLKIVSFNSSNNNDVFQINIPSHDLTDDVDYNELYIIIAIVGDQGIAFGEKYFNVIPGGVAPTEIVNLNYISY